MKRHLFAVLCGVLLILSAHPLQAGAEQTWREPATGMEFLWVPGGCFQMGDTFGGNDAQETPVHEVCLEGFWMARLPVTETQWQQVMGALPVDKPLGGDYPAQSVTWQEAKAFVARMNAKAEGKARFRLPTEAEWEYACRSGGKAQMYAGGNKLDPVGWSRQTSGGVPQPAGRKAPNGLGLQDMSGNVFQWTEDVYGKDAYAHHARNNPLNTEGWGRVARGGYWGAEAYCARCAFRCYISDRCKGASTGLRLVRSAER